MAEGYLGGRWSEQDIGTCLHTNTPHFNVDPSPGSTNFVDKVPPLTEL